VLIKRGVKVFTFVVYTSVQPYWLIVQNAQFR